MCMRACVCKYISIHVCVYMCVCYAFVWLCRCVAYSFVFCYCGFTQKISIRAEFPTWFLSRQKRLSEIVFYFFFLPDYFISSTGNVAASFSPVGSVQKKGKELPVDRHGGRNWLTNGNKFRNPHCCEATMKRPLMIRHWCWQDPWAEQTRLQRIL